MTRASCVAADRLGTRLSLCRRGLARQLAFSAGTCREEHWREPSPAAARSGPTGGPESAPRGAA